MPTNQNAYNSRVTSEALEKKFRDTFTSQGGAELLDDLYASGVVVPVVDFSAAAEGSELGQNLQTALDFSINTVVRTSPGFSDVVNTPGFYDCFLFYNLNTSQTQGDSVRVEIFDGSSAKSIRTIGNTGSSNNAEEVGSDQFVVFLRSGDLLRVGTFNSSNFASMTARQIADVSGNLVNPLGFTSS